MAARLRPGREGTVAGADGEVVSGVRVDMQFCGDAGSFQGEVHQHAVLGWADQIASAMNEKDWGSAFGDIQPWGELILVFILEVTGIRHDDERACDTLTVDQSEIVSNAIFRWQGCDMASGSRKIKLDETLVAFQSRDTHRLCGSAGASPSRNAEPEIASRFVVQKLIAGFVIALCLTTVEDSASFAQDAAKPMTATEPASGLAFREGGRRILIGKEGGIFFVAAQQTVRKCFRCLAGDDDQTGRWPDRSIQ